MICFLQLINLTQRRQPPPDLFMLKNGFVLNEDEAIDKRIRRRIINRRSKRIFIPPKELTEDEFVEKCKSAVRAILLEVSTVEWLVTHNGLPRHNKSVQLEFMSSFE